MRKLLLATAILSSSAMAADFSIVIPSVSYHWESRSYTNKETGLKTEWNETNKGLGVEYKQWRFTVLDNSFGDTIGAITHQKPLYEHVTLSYGLAFGYKNRSTDKMVIEHVTPVAALEFDYQITNKLDVVFGAHYAGFFTLHFKCDF